MNEKDNSDKKEFFKSWLEQLQQESWQLELLISGFAIFGIYSARPFINLMEISRVSSDSEFEILVGGTLQILASGWYIFFINLIFHVILRGLWIGAIGLRYVSNEIEYEDLNYSPIFTDYLRKKVGSYDDFIEKLETICSVIFAYTFLLFLLFASFVFFFLSVGLVMVFSQTLDPLYGGILMILMLVYVVGGLIVFIDFITVGGFKKIKDRSVSKVYLYIYRFYSFVTLSFLYRPLLYNFIDDKYTRRLFFFSIPYILVILVGSKMVKIERTPYVPSTRDRDEFGLQFSDYSYDDRRNELLTEFPNEFRTIEKKELPALVLRSFEIEGSYLYAFVRVYPKYNKTLKENDDLFQYFDDGLTSEVFNFNVIDDPMMDSLNQRRAGQLEPYLKEFKLVRRSMRKAEGSVDSTQYFYYRNIIDSIKEIYSEMKLDRRASKAINSLEAYDDLIELYIDGDTVKNYRKYFYKHPHANEFGIQYIISIDSLTEDFHDITLKRPKVNALDITLPFIKI